MIIGRLPIYWLSEKLTATLGYAHMWKAPARRDWDTWPDEERIYQQVQQASKIGSVSMLNRLRNEQRWQEKVENDEIGGGYSFSNRVRYLLSFTIPVASNPQIPSFVLSDEVLVQFGPGVDKNAFDQNRFFVGIKQRLSSSWSFDFGYMPVLQQKSGGDQYDLNDTLRLFFYFTPNLGGTKSVREPAGTDE